MQHMQGNFRQMKEKSEKALLYIVCSSKKGKAHICPRNLMLGFTSGNLHKIGPMPNT